MMPGGLSLTILVALPFIGSLVAGLMPTAARTGAAVLAGAVALVGFVIDALSFPAVADGAVLRHSIEWVPELNLNVILRLDGLSWLFAMMITGIGFLVVLYARYYMSPKDPVPRFFSFLLVFMGAID